MADITLPVYAQEIDINFNNNPVDTIVLSEADEVRKLIVWDNLSNADKSTLVDFVAAHGGVAPSTAGPTAGKVSVNYGAAVGTTLTGLNAGSAATAGSQNIQFSTAVVGSAATGLANDTTAYTATVTVDSVAKPVSIVGSDAQTFTTLVAQINTDLGASATASIVGSNIRVVSSTTGTTSTVAIVDGTLLAALTGFTSVAAAVAGTNAVPATVYTATVTVDSGTPVAVSIPATANQTFAQLVTALGTAIGSGATVALDSGKIVITSATTGADSKVVVVDGTLFHSVAGYVGITTTPGADSVDLWHVFQTTRSPNGALYSDIYRVLFVGDKPVILPHVPKTMQFTYFSNDQWLYMSDDTPVCAV